MQLRVGVKVLLIDQKGALLILRRTKPLSNGKIVWDIPGGRIDSGETTEVALQREVLEETGIVLSENRELIDAQDIFPYDDMHIVRLTYACHIENRSIILSSEHDKYVWASREMLDDYEVDPYIKNSMKEFYGRA